LEFGRGGGWRCVGEEEAPSEYFIRLWGEIGPFIEGDTDRTKLESLLENRNGYWSIDKVGWTALLKSVGGMTGKEEMR